MFTFCDELIKNGYVSEQELFLLSKNIQTALGSNGTAIQWLPEFFPGVKAAWA